MSEVQIKIAAQEGVVLTYLKNGKINEATACFAEKFARLPLNPTEGEKHDRHSQGNR